MKEEEIIKAAIRASQSNPNSGSDWWLLLPTIASLYFLTMLAGAFILARVAVKMMKRRRAVIK